MAGWPFAVNALEVGERRAYIAQTLDFGFGLEWRTVGGNVMGNKLREERPAGRNAGLVLAGSAERRAVACSVFDPELKQKIVVPAVALEMWKQPSISARAQRV